MVGEAAANGARPEPLLPQAERISPTSTITIAAWDRRRKPRCIPHRHLVGTTYIPLPIAGPEPADDSMRPQASPTTRAKEMALCLRAGPRCGSDILTGGVPPALTDRCLQACTVLVRCLSSEDF